ncbi:MAG TPA: GAF domain-containing protein [Acidimicrobiales bacterium]
MNGGDARGAFRLLDVLETVEPPLDQLSALYRIVDVLRDELAAERCAVFIVDGGSLTPAAVASRRASRDLFRRFRTMQPIAVQGEHRRAEVFATGEIVVAEDAAASDLVPATWLDAFGTVSFAAAPVVGRAGARALVVVDYTSPHTFTPDETACLRAAGEVVRIVIETVALADRVRVLEDARRRLQSAIALSVATSDPLEAAEALLDVISSTLHRGASLTMVVDGASCTVSTGSRDGATTLFPLGVGSSRVGSLEVHGGPLDDDAVDLCASVAQQAAVTLDRARLRAEARQRTHVTEIMERVPHLLDGSTTVGDVLDRLNREVCRRAGFECVDAAFRSVRDADAVGARRLAPGELTMLRRSPDGAALEHLDRDGRIAVTIPVNRRPVGVLTARLSSALAAPSPDQRSLLLTIGRAIGDLVARTSMHLELRSAERRLEISDARVQLSDHLDQTLGGTLRQLWARLGEVAATDRDGRLGDELAELRELAGTGLLQAHMVGASLSLLKVRSEGLVAALRALVHSFGEATRTGAVLRVHGDVSGLGSEVEEALYLAAFEALSLQGPARSTTVVVTLDGADEVSLVVRDDGAGLGQRTAIGEGASMHRAMAVIRDRLALVGGGLHVVPAKPRGVRLEVRVPRRTPPRGAMMSSSPPAQIVQLSAIAQNDRHVLGPSS